MECTIIIPAIGFDKHLLKTMKNLVENTTIGAEKLLIYNGKKGGEKQFIDCVKRKFPSANLKVIASDVPYNIAHAVNLGFRRAKTKFLVVMDSDVRILEKGWLRESIKIMKKYPNIGVLGCSVAKYIDRKPEELGFLDKDKKIKICDYAPTIMVTRKNIVENGCYIDEFFRIGSYDIDWQTTVRSKGYLVTNYRIKHLHVGGVSCDHVFRNKKILKNWLNEAPRIMHFIEKHKNTLNKKYYDSIKKKYSKKWAYSQHIFLAKWRLNLFRGKVIRFIKYLLRRY